MSLWHRTITVKRDNFVKKDEPSFLPIVFSSFKFRKHATYSFTGVPKVTLVWGNLVHPQLVINLKLIKGPIKKF